MVALVILYKLLSLELDTHVAGGILLSLYLSVTCELINQTVPGIARCHGSLYTARLCLLNLKVERINLVADFVDSVNLVFNL